MAGRVNFLRLPNCTCCQPDEIYIELDEQHCKKADELRGRGYIFTAKAATEMNYVSFSVVHKNGGLPLSHSFCHNGPGTREAIIEIISVAHALAFYDFKTFE